MITEDGTSFEDWFSIIKYYLREVLNYEGKIDKEYFIFYYKNDENLTCEDAAKNYVKNPLFKQ